MTFFAAVIEILILLAIVELVAYLLIKSLGYIATLEFPEVSSTLIEKTASFDSELGHLPLLNGVAFPFGLYKRKLHEKQQHLLLSPDS